MFKTKINPYDYQEIDYQEEVTQKSIDDFKYNSKGILNIFCRLGKTYITLDC